MRDKLPHWSLECDKIVVLPRSQTLTPAPFHPKAIQAALTQLATLHTVGQPSVELCDWRVTPAFAGAVAAAPESQPPLPMIVVETTITDKTVDCVLQMGPRVRSLKAEHCRLFPEKPRDAVWYVTELRAHDTLKLAGLRTLPQCVAGSTCRVYCKEIELGGWPGVSKHRHCMHRMQGTACEGTACSEFAKQCHVVL